MFLCRCNPKKGMNMEKKYRVAIVDKDNSEKMFWTKEAFSKKDHDAWDGTQKAAEAEAQAAKTKAEEQFGCPCPYDIIVESTDGAEWYIPGGDRIDG